MAKANPNAWEEVEDLDGNAHYEILELQREATQDDVKIAYRRLARIHHPDKGGAPDVFSKLKQAYEVLSDPEKREAYDTWQKHVEFRHIKGVAPRYDGGEDMMLDEFEKRSGSDVDPFTQLVVVCEVCSRPSTTECWTCGMKICEFCTLKRHWKGKFGLHWPLVNKPGYMLEQLAKKEMEKKRLEDAKRYELEDPTFRNDLELKHIRDFKDAAYDLLETFGKDAKMKYDLRLAKHYMWAQTSCYIYIAVYIPTGYEDKELMFETSGMEVKLQAENSPPIIHRIIASDVSLDYPIETRRSKDNRIFTAAIPKASPGEKWKKVFRGDPDGARCMETPYSIVEDAENVILEFELPFWIDSKDVRVDISSKDLRVHVKNELDLQKTYWRNAEEERKNPSEYAVVDVEQSAWFLDEDTGKDGERCQCLLINLVKPPLTQSEIKWKKGKRNDNLNADRFGSKSRKGYRFFVDDEDEYDLEDLLQSMCFLESGSAHVPKKPWDSSGTTKTVDDVDLLSEEVQKCLDSFLKE